jgi:hypothetical protein
MRKKHVFLFLFFPAFQSDGVDGHTMAASDELRDKRAHKNKGVKVNDMTVAIGIASVFALFIFLAVSHTSQVGHRHTCLSFVLRIQIALQLGCPQHSQEYKSPLGRRSHLRQALSLTHLLRVHTAVCVFGSQSGSQTDVDAQLFSHCCLCVWGSKRLPDRRRCTAFFTLLSVCLGLKAAPRQTSRCTAFSPSVSPSCMQLVSVSQASARNERRLPS